MTIRVGIIGLNHGAEVHLKTYKASSKYEVVAVCARTPGRAEAVAQEHGIARWHTDPRDIFRAPDIDLVSVASPPATHTGYIMAAMATGKHVAVEVAFVPHADDAHVLLDIARERGNVGAVAFVLRYAPNLRFIADLLEQKIIGEPRLMRFDYFANFLALNPGQSRWMLDGENGGGILAGSVAHVVDLARRWFGPVREVSAHLTTLTDVSQLPGTGSLIQRGALADDTGQVTLHFASGMLATINYSAAVAYPQTVIDLHGTRGTLHIEGLGDEVSLLRMGEASAEVLFPPDHYIEATRGGDKFRGGFTIFTDHLATAITTGTPPPELPTFQDGWEVMRLVDAAKQASKEKRRVTVSA